MGGKIVSLVTTEHGDRDIAILNEAAAVQPAIETVCDPVGLIAAFRIRAVARAVAQQAKGLSHLRFSFINRAAFAAGACFGRTGQLIRLVFADGILKAKF